MADPTTPDHRATIIRLCAMVARFAGGRTGDEEAEGEMLIEAAKRAADEMRAELDRLRPVYSAAVEWRRSDAVSRGFGGKAELTALADAVDATMEKEQDDGK